MNKTALAAAADAQAFLGDDPERRRRTEIRRRTEKTLFFIVRKASAAATAATGCVQAAAGGQTLKSSPDSESSHSRLKARSLADSESFMNKRSVTEATLPAAEVASRQG